MKIIRITVMKNEVGENEALFNQKLTERLISAGFDLKEMIIQQQRSDVFAIDYIQLRYSWWDTFMAHLQHDLVEVVNWVNRQFADPETLENPPKQYIDCSCKEPWVVGMTHQRGEACYWNEHKPKK